MMCFRLINFLTLCLAVIIAGCASLPAGIPVSELAQEEAKQAFADMIDSQQSCTDQIDADVSVKFESLFYKGEISGYLQAMAPAYLRFDGLNPFGLTETVFSIDGGNFTFLAVREQIAYHGAVEAKKFEKYAPKAFLDDLVFFLNGLVPVNDKYTISRVRGEAEGQGFWLDLNYHNSVRNKKFLFRPAEQEIDRIIISEKGNDPVMVNYLYSSSAENNCSKPVSIQVDANGSEITIKFNKRYPMPSIKKDNFQIIIPPNYKKVSVQ